MINWELGGKCFPRLFITISFLSTGSVQGCRYFSPERKEAMMCYKAQPFGRLTYYSLHL